MTSTIGGLEEKRNQIRGCRLNVEDSFRDVYFDIQAGGWGD